MAVPFPWLAVAEVARGAGRVGLGAAVSTSEILVAAVALAPSEGTLRHWSLDSWVGHAWTTGEAGDVLGSA